MSLFSVTNWLVFQNAKNNKQQQKEKQITNKQTNDFKHYFQKRIEKRKRKKIDKKKTKHEIRRRHMPQHKKRICIRLLGGTKITMAHYYRTTKKKHLVDDVYIAI